MRDFTVPSGWRRSFAISLLPAGMRGNSIFLHDASVRSLDNLLDPSRGNDSPHPFYVSEPAKRRDVVEFLRGLEATTAGSAQR